MASRLPISEATLTLPVPPSASLPSFTWQIATGDSQTHYFTTRYPRERQQWLTHIAAANATSSSSRLHNTTTTTSNNSDMELKAQLEQTIDHLHDDLRLAQERGLRQEQMIKDLMSRLIAPPPPPPSPSSANSATPIAFGSASAIRPVPQSSPTSTSSSVASGRGNRPPPTAASLGLVIPAFVPKATPSSTATGALSSPLSTSPPTPPSTTPSPPPSASITGTTSATTVVPTSTTTPVATAATSGAPIVVVDSSTASGPMVSVTSHSIDLSSSTRSRAGADEPTTAATATNNNANEEKRVVADDKPSLAAIPSTSPPASSNSLSHNDGGHAMQLRVNDNIVNEVKHDIRIWVITWNMGAKDLAPGQVAHIRQTIPLGYDLYVVGVQEGVTTSFFDAIQVYLENNHCVRLTINSMLINHCLRFA
jgi:hypothetical protein